MRSERSLVVTSQKQPNPLPSETGDFGATETGDHMRKDDGKARMDLIPPEFLLALGELYEMGAKKYSDRGWEAGMDWGRCYAPLQRHVLKWWCGQKYDPKDGQHHLVSVVWNAIALWEYERREVGTDDRPDRQVVNERLLESIEQLRPETWNDEHYQGKHREGLGNPM